MSAAFALALAFLAPGLDAPADSVNVSTAAKARHGFLVHEVRSLYQAGTTEIRVLLPDRMENGRRYPVVFLLPVEAGREDRYGDGLLEAKKLDLHNKLQVIFVAPTFSHLPWYADHPTDAAIRQESYFLKVVVPFIRAHYPVQQTPDGLFLVGFSKSGWGAFSLLLRHPAMFAKAAAWDAPLMMQQPNRFGTGDIFATQGNFADYQISKLLEQQAATLRQGKRLILLGYGSFRDHHQSAHALMAKLAIDREYHDGPARPHDWHNGWLQPAVELLLAGRTHQGAIDSVAHGHCCADEMRTTLRFGRRFGASRCRRGS